MRGVPNRGNPTFRLVSCILPPFANEKASLTRVSPVPFLAPLLLLWDPPPPPSCSRGKSGERTSRRAPSPWPSLTKGLPRSAPGTFDKKNLCLKTLAMRVGASFRREPRHHLSWRPRREHGQGPGRSSLLEMNPVSAERQLHQNNG